GFALAGTEVFEHPERMSAEQLTAYLLTQTNVIAAVESGSTPLADAEAWIRAGVTPFCAGQTRTLKFAGALWYLRRAKRPGGGGATAIVYPTGAVCPRPPHSNTLRLPCPNPP